MQRKENKLIRQKTYRCLFGGILTMATVIGCTNTPQLVDSRHAGRTYRKQLYGAKADQSERFVPSVEKSIVENQIIHNGNEKNSIVEHSRVPNHVLDNAIAWNGDRRNTPVQGAASLVGEPPTNRIVRGQTAGDEVLEYTGLADASDAPVGNIAPAQYELPQPSSDPSVGPITSGNRFLPPPIAGAPEAGFPTMGIEPVYRNRADLVVDVDETQTGRFQFGVGINSDAGATAQIVIDEQNFDWRRFPHSWEEVMNGTAFRGGGQRLRIEAIPGNQLQRYLVNFTEPYLFDTPISLNVSGFLYDRRFFDWDEQRLGGRLGLGYRLNHDLSIAASMRAEQVTISDPRVRGVGELEQVLGENDIFSGRLTLTHDTRNSPFAPSEGQYVELSFEQVFGDYNYPRAGVDFRRYFLLTERIDGTGKHVLGTSIQAGFSGSDTPLFENYFAGGYSTLRGFRFRGASPTNNSVIVGGEFSLLGSTEYVFPITADEMLRGVFFADYGTIEEQIEINQEDFRVSVGFGLRVSVPGLGFGAPIAIDFAIPIARESTDQIQNFSFFMGVGR